MISEDEERDLDRELEEFEEAYANSKARAFIISGRDGGPIRTILGRGYTRVPSMFPSVKLGRRISCEADHERLLVEICEADPYVVSYVTQPHRLSMRTPQGKWLHYFPDLKREFADGSIEIVETKKSKSEISTSSRPAYAHKLWLAASIYRRMRWKFSVLTAEDDLNVQPLQANARMISDDGGTQVTVADIFALQTCDWDAGYPVTYDDAIIAIAAASDLLFEQARAKLHAMVVERMVGIDIHGRITPQTPLRLLADEDTERRLRRRNLSMGGSLKELAKRMSKVA